MVSLLSVPNLVDDGIIVALLISFQMLLPLNSGFLHQYLFAGFFASIDFESVCTSSADPARGDVTENSSARIQHAAKLNQKCTVTSEDCEEEDDDRQGRRIQQQ
jgi:hypothetical protein